jgi:hypothetical protein
MSAATMAPVGKRLRSLLPLRVRRAAARVIAEQRASSVRRQLEGLASGGRPILIGPWLGEVGFELLYWLPFLRWFAEEYRIPPERLVAVSRGGGAAAWYGELVARHYDALTFLSAHEFRRRNDERSDQFGEQKQIAASPLDDEIVAFVRQRERGDLAVLHPSTMYRLFAPYWWGHQPVGWVRRFTRFTRLQPPAVDVALPAEYTAVKFYFNDCFRDARENRRFVERTVRDLASQGAVISLSTGVAVDGHEPCDPDVAAIDGIRHLLAPESNLLVQSAIVARARRFVGTYGGFAYLAPLCGVPAVSYFSDPGAFSVRHLDLMRDVLASSGGAGLLEVRQAHGRVQ